MKVLQEDVLPTHAEGARADGKFSRSMSFSGIDTLKKKPPILRSNSYSFCRENSYGQVILTSGENGGIVLSPLTSDFRKTIPKYNPPKCRNYFWEILYKYPNKAWNWYEVSRNPNITPEILKEYKNDKNFQWDRRGILENPNIYPDYKNVGKKRLEICLKKSKYNF